MALWVEVFPGTGRGETSMINMDFVRRAIALDGRDAGMYRLEWGNEKTAVIKKEVRYKGLKCDLLEVLAGFADKQIEAMGLSKKESTGPK